MFLVELAKFSRNRSTNLTIKSFNRMGGLVIAGGGGSTMRLVPQSYEKTSNLKLSGNEVYYAAFLDW
jgi:hypothetical protein